MKTTFSLRSIRPSSAFWNISGNTTPKFSAVLLAAVTWTFSSATMSSRAASKTSRSASDQSVPYAALSRSMITDSGSGSGSVFLPVPE